MTFSSLETAAIALAAGTALAVTALSTSKKGADKAYPPGPAGIPLLGNVHQLKLSQPWLTFTEWRDIYGDITYCRLANQDVVLLNSEETAADLLDKRSLNYSDRTNLSCVLESYSLGSMTPFIPHDDVWRSHRRIFHQGMRGDVVGTYHSAQAQCALDLVDALEKTPDQWYGHLRRYSAAVILSAIYDHKLEPGDDFIYDTILEATEALSKIASPINVSLVTICPLLKYAPTWSSGRWFNAARCRNLIRDMSTIPFASLEEKMASGQANECFGLGALKRFRNTNKVEDFERVVRDVCGIAYVAGEETTGATLIVFMLAMVLYPEVQKRAQEEIDRVIGPDRLPEFQDRASLPYLEAVYRETLRWKPVGPIGVPHAATNEDVYEGYHIPKDAVMIPNIWAMTQNPVKYPEPSAFKPERFLNSEQKLNDDTVAYVFGFGRRICPGRHFASGSSWIAMAEILASFNISKAKDAAGNPVNCEPDWYLAITTYPKPFPCTIVPRK